MQTADGAHVVPETAPGRHLPRYLVVLLVVILAGFVLLVTVHVTFSELISDLDAKTNNEAVRLAIGEAIVQEIAQLETGVYKLATTQNQRGRDLQQDQLYRQLGQLAQMLAVLEHGGHLERVTRLNMANREHMVRRLSYRVGPEPSRIVLEVIDLAPKLQQVRQKIDQLSALLMAREALFEAGTTEEMRRSLNRVLHFVKTLPPLFTRMKENAGRMYFESSNELAALERSIEAQKERLLHIEMALIVVIILSVMTFGLKVSRQIHDSNRRLQQATKDMAEAMAAAQAASQAKSAFLATMSHEIRTPMNGVIGMAGLLQEDPKLNAEQRRSVGVIRESGEALLNIINDILDFSKLEAGRLELEDSEFDLQVTIEAVVDILMPRARAAGLEIDAVLPAELEGVYRGDAGRLRQVIMNLMGNATKFTHQGSVRLKVSGRPANENGGRLHFAVIDTGIGIPEQARHRLFQSFSQLDASTSRKYGGSGLGLAISKRLVEAMGGEIGVESEPGVGSNFWFELPLERVGPASAALNDGYLRVIRETRILLIDTDRASREAAAASLDRLGATYDAIDNLEAGLERLALASNAYGLVLCGCESPAIPVAQIAARLRAGAGTASLPLVLVSSQPSASLYQEIGEQLSAVCISKPLQSDTLFEALVSALNLRHRETSSAPLLVGASSEKRRRVLVVEDNAINQMVALRMLERLGCCADVAANGIEAVEAARRLPYDLVLMDVQMPEMNGLDATRAIRAQESGGQRLPIVAMTANAMKGDAETCFEAGMDDYLSKPIKRADLSRVLARYLDLAKPAPADAPVSHERSPSQAQGT